MRSRSIVVTLSALLLMGGQALAAPDLVVTDIELIPDSPVVGMGTLRAHFQNIGPDDVDLSFGVFTDLVFQLDGLECHAGFILELNAGETTTQDATSCNSLTPGNHTIVVEVDSNSEVSEANEANNSRTEIFAWVPASAVPGLEWIAAFLVSTALGAAGVRRLRAVVPASHPSPD